MRKFWIISLVIIIIFLLPVKDIKKVFDYMTINFLWTPFIILLVNLKMFQLFNKTSEQTEQSNNLTQEALEQNKIHWREENRPYVYIDSINPNEGHDNQMHWMSLNCLNASSIVVSVKTTFRCGGCNLKNIEELTTLPRLFGKDDLPTDNSTNYIVYPDTKDPLYLNLSEPVISHILELANLCEYNGILYQEVNVTYTAFDKLEEFIHVSFWAYDLLNCKDDTKTNCWQFFHWWAKNKQEPKPKSTWKYVSAYGT